MGDEIKINKSKGRYSSNTLMMEDLKILLTSMDRMRRQKLSNETTALMQTLDQTDLVDIYITFYPTNTEYIFISTQKLFQH